MNHRESQQSKVAKLLKSIPSEDRVYLEFYFRYLLFDDPLAYVIFGDKPMALSGFWNPTPSGNCLTPNISHNSVILRKGYELHKKYQHLLPSKNFIFVFRESDDYTEIALVNRKNFLKTTANSIEEFQKILGKKISGATILDRFVIEKEIFEKPLKENHALLGLLLGYGKKNSFRFQRKMEILKSTNAFHLHHKQEKCLRPSIGFDSLDEELAFLNQRLKPLEDPCQEFTLVNLPSFMVDSRDIETQGIKKKFIEQRRKITNIYRHGDFLEITLNYLASNEAQ